MPNPIPTRSREVVAARDQGRCLRCGGMTGAWHHRRSRRIIDAHTHCACNGVSLCITCHSWVHTHPNEARRSGWIVSAWVYPHDAKVQTVQYGWVLLTCAGGFTLLHTQDDNPGECQGCGRVVDELEAGLCKECIEAEVCCPSAHVARQTYCGCGGSAAEALRRLRERIGS